MSFPDYPDSSFYTVINGNKMHYLDEVEEELRESIPELNKFNVIITQDRKVH